jgi:futalosine hydrolase
MNLLFVSATPFEVAPLRQYLVDNFWSHHEAHFQREDLDLKLLVTGVGMPQTAFALGQMFAQHKFDLAINAGVAGAFDRSLNLGDVVNIVSERFGDLGVEEADGTFTDVHELGLLDANQPPFQNGALTNPAVGDFDFLPKRKGLTVNKVHGSSASIEAIQKKYEVEVESMEGAAFFQACLLARVNFLELRSISNYVEPRNREAWDLPKAIENLNDVLIRMVKTFSA